VIERCEECGFNGVSLAPADVAEALEVVAATIGDVVGELDQDRLRMMPAPGRWSPLGYLVHLRDVMAFHRWLIERAVTEDGVVVAAPDPDVAMDGVDLDVLSRDGLLEQLDRRVDRLRELLVGLDEKAGSRALSLAPQPGLVDVRRVARNALHEAVHHARDLRATQPDPGEAQDA
jgi:hypothetical protein